MGPSCLDSLTSCAITLPVAHNASTARLTPVQRRELTDWLRKELYAISLQQRKRDGRVTLRRMNRTEHEHTLQDMLGITTRLKDLIPDDATTAGFDKVSTGLGISSTHHVR